MSDYGDGTPPPPPPYGGGQGGTPYGQPYGQQPPPPGQPYGQPPASDPYGQQPPAYGAPADPYGQQPPAYGAPQQPAYGAQPQYGAPAPYGQPYGAAPYGGPPVGVPGNVASMGKRLGARLIDSVIGSVIVYGLGFLLIGGAASTVQTDETGQVTSGLGTLFGALIIWGLVAFAFGLLYELIMIALKGATLGKMALGIKVIREADGQIPGWGPSGVRYLIQVAGSLVCGLGLWVVWLSPFFDNTGRQQGWHDKVAKTLVVNK